MNLFVHVSYICSTCVYVYRHESMWSTDTCGRRDSGITHAIKITL